MYLGLQSFTPILNIFYCNVSGLVHLVFQILHCRKNIEHASSFLSASDMRLVQSIRGGPLNEGRKLSTADRIQVVKHLCLFLSYIAYSTVFWASWPINPQILSEFVHVARTILNQGHPAKNKNIPKVKTLCHHREIDHVGHFPNSSSSPSSQQAIAKRRSIYTKGRLDLVCTVQEGRTGSRGQKQKGYRLQLAV